MAGVDPDSVTEMSFELADGADGTVTVRIGGELDITNVDELGSAVQRALAEGPERVIVDARELRFADSSAIALWVQWAAAVPDLELQGASPFLRRVIESMGLTDTLGLKP